MTPVPRWLLLGAARCLGAIARAKLEGADDGETLRAAVRAVARAGGDEALSNARRPKKQAIPESQARAAAKGSSTVGRTRRRRIGAAVEASSASSSSSVEAVTGEVLSVEETRRAVDRAARGR